MWTFYSACQFYISSGFVDLIFPKVDHLLENWQTGHFTLDP